MRGVNKVILVATLGKDPETKTFQNGGSITQFSVATSEAWTDKNTGEKKEDTQWHNIVMQNRLGEIAQQYLKKGSKVYLEGKLRTRKWQDQNGQDRYSTEIVCNNMQMLDSSPQQGQQQPQQQGGYGSQQQQSQLQQQAVSYGRPQAQPSQSLDDDLPF